MGLRRAALRIFLSATAPAFSLALLCLPAHAFDCAKASTKVEKAICAAPDLKAADDAMAAAYSSLHKTLDKTQQPALRANQAEWIGRREGYCGYEEETAKLNACIGDMTQARSSLLAGEPAAGPGTGTPLEPVFVAQKGSKARYDVKIAAQKFAGPGTTGERAFNETVDALIAEAPFKDRIDFDPPGQLSYEMVMQVAYASPRLVSARAEIYRYDGGAHPNSHTVNVNIDPRDGGLLDFGALFKDSARAGLTAACREQIAAEKRVRFNEETAGDEAMQPYEEALKDGVEALGQWSFTGEGAVVVFDPYALGAYAEGRYECSFGYDMLKQLAMDPAVFP